MIDSASRNLYAAGGAAAPFAGRGAAFAHLRRHLIDPTLQSALLVQGRKGIGKTAFLRAFEGAFDEAFVGVYIPLRAAGSAQESEWWLTLAQSTTEALLERAFTLTRLQEMQPPQDDARDWFIHSFLPPVLALIRPHRRLVLLMDDAEVMMDAIQQGLLRTDTPHYLRAMMDQFNQFDIVLTLDTRFESRLNALEPLISPTNTIRLTQLAPDETAWLLTEPVRGRYALEEEALNAAYRLTSGEPAFVQMIGTALYRRYLAEDSAHFTTDDIKRLSQTLYRQVEATLRETWDALTYNEQQVLKAISQLLYADPLRPVSVDAVAGWLADGEEPLDATSIRAALRSLEYREIVTLLPTGIQINAEWMQRFLLENAYNVPLNVARREEAGPSGTGILRRRNRGVRIALLVILIAAFIVGLLLLSALSSLPQEVDALSAEPTITLFGSG